MSEEKKKGRSGNKIIELSKVSKIRPISFSMEEIEDPEIDEMTRESLMQEADQLEEELNNDPELMGVGASDDLFLSIVNKLKEQGVWEEENAEDPDVKSSSDVDETYEAEKNVVESVDNIPEIEESCAKQEDIYRMLSEEDLQALMLGREVARQKEEKKIRKQRQRRNVRRIASVAAVFVVVFMVGMTSEANRRLVLNAWDAVMTMAGFKMETDYVENEKIIRAQDEEERLAWEEAEEKLGISALLFTYMSEEMFFLQYEIVEEMNTATYLYAYNDNILEIKVINVTRFENNGSVYLVRDENAMLETSILIDKNVEVEIWQTDMDLEMPSYLCEFEYNGCRYVISGMIPLEEIKKIIKNTIFL